MPQVFAEELKSIPMSPNLGDGLERAHRFAREQAHRFVMLEHLLLALTEDQEAALILQSANVDLARLSADVAGYLGRLPDDMRSDGATEPRPDPELLRVLQAAASAAQQSKRRQIDGAIVLAAIVGDGKSPAAGLLKTHGMTFEEAIRALQLANTKARLKPIPKATATTRAAPAPPPEPMPPPPARAYEPPPQAAATVRAAMPDPGSTPAAETEPASAEQSTRAAVQSADDILAAARARIQKRAATLNQPAPGGLNGSAGAPPAAQVQERDDGMSSAMRELLAVSAPVPEQVPPPREPAPELNGAAHQHVVRPQPQEPVSPEPARASPIQLAPVVPLEPASLPAAANGVAAAPLPQLGAVTPGRPTRVAPPAPDRMQPLPPWPAAGPGPAPAQRQPASPSGPAGEPHRLTRAAAPLPSFPQGPPRKGGSGQDRGPLVESIPRRMKLGVTSIGEVRIPRSKLDGLVQAMTARAGAGAAGPGAHEPIVARALSIRLRSPSESFFIEPMSPETQFVETGPGLAPDDALHWRWHLTPRHRGKGKLTVQVSLRNAGLNGPGEELPLPDRQVDVKIRGRTIRRLLRSVFYVGLLAVAVFLGRVGGELGPMLVRSLRSVAGL